MIALTEPQRRMVEDHLHIASIAASKAHRRNRTADREECFASAAYGLMQAASRYDASKSKFTTSGPIRAAGQIIDDLRNKTRWFNYGPSRSQQTPEGLPSEMRASHGDFARVDSLDEFEAMIRDLPKREKEIMRMYYVEGLPMSRIGVMKGISESTVSLVHSKAIKTLRRLL